MTDFININKSFVPGKLKWDSAALTCFSLELPSELALFAWIPSMPHVGVDVNNSLMLVTFELWFCRFGL